MRGFQPGRVKGKAHSFAKGGMVRGPGTGTSDDVEDTVPSGTYIMPADSTKKIGKAKLETMGAEGGEPEEPGEAAEGESPEQEGAEEGGEKKGVPDDGEPNDQEGVPVNLSNGEFKLSPEQVHAIGIEVLNQIKAGTHSPTKGFTPKDGAAGEEPRMFFSGGGPVWDKKDEIPMFGKPGDFPLNPDGSPIKKPMAAAPVAPSATTAQQDPMEGKAAFGYFPQLARPPQKSPPSTAGFVAGGSSPSDPTAVADRQAASGIWSGIKDMNNRAGAAIADVATLPLRGVAGAYDTAVVRPMRAAGLNAAYLSPNLVPNGANVDSITPFYDQIRAKDQTQSQDQPTAIAPAQPSNAGAGRGAKNPALVDPSQPVTASAPASMPTSVDGVSRINAPGASPLFTNLPADSASNVNLMARGFAPTAQNAGAASALSDRYGNEVAGINAKAQYNAEVANAQRINAAPTAADTGGYGILSKQYQDRRNASMAADPKAALSQLATRNVNADNNQQRATEAAGSQALEARRLDQQGQQLGFQTQLAREKQALDARRANAEIGGINADTTVKGLSAKSAERMASLQEKYMAAKPEDQAAIAQQIRAISGGAKPESPWKVHVTPATKNVDGSTTEGLVIRENTQTGQVERVDLNNQKSPIEQNQAALAIKNNTSMSREQKVAELKKLGY